jgi:hypothetical protein
MQCGQPELVAAWPGAFAGIWWQPSMPDAIGAMATLALDAGAFPCAAHGLAVPATSVMATRTDNTNRRTPARTMRTPP